MVTKRIRTWLLFCFCLLTTLPVQAELGQVLQINTQFQSILGTPTWLLILHDIDTGRVSPYMFNIRKNDNFWIAFTWGHTYQVTASILQFDTRTVINNFCHLQDGILSGKSMYIMLKGELTADPNSSQCYITKYQDTPFPLISE